jgi:cysteine-rich repeat protein
LINTEGDNPEECDDGNDDDSGNGCSIGCQRNDVCGDGIVQGLFEECDDGDAFDSGNGCSAACLRNNSCGDGVVEPVFEQCDLGADNGEPGECCTDQCAPVVPGTACPEPPPAAPDAGVDAA